MNWTREPNDYHQPRFTESGETIPTGPAIAFALFLIVSIVLWCWAGYAS